MGGKTSTSTSGVTIPPEVLARYNAVNADAATVAQTPFQQYSTNPNAFVAPMTATQNAGVAGTNAAANMAQPYYGAATGFALAGANPVNAQPLNTSQYMNPYLQAVLGSTEANVNQQNQQAMSGQTGNAMSQGYFGGDRSGIASAVLQGQQQLTGGQLYSGIASDAYNQAMAAAQQQQGVNFGAATANRAAIQQTADTLAGLGTGAQTAALSGAQAQLGAGQVEQQTQQAGDTALYNQFLQQQSFPFQTAQFEANIAEGTGALSGSTTTQTTPGGLFSDERLKEDMQPIGKGFDGANIYRFRYRGDPTTRIGMSAQEVERKHPEAVGESGGFKTVDYGQATDDAARRGGFALAANDNTGDDQQRRARQAGGGMSEWGSYPAGVNPMVIAELLQAQAQMYGPGFGGAGLYGGSASGTPHGGAGYVPQANLPVPMLQVSHPISAPSQESALHQVAQTAGDIKSLQSDAHDVHQGYDWWRDNAPVSLGGDPASGMTQDVMDQYAKDAAAAVAPQAGTPTAANGGFFRARRQDGGLSDPENDNPYAPKGPGLNIPMQGAATPHLATAPAPGGGGNGLLGQAAGAAGDISSLIGAGKAISSIPGVAGAAGAIGSGIAGAAGGIGSTIAGLLPFLALQRGGRAGYAVGGEADGLDIPDDTPHAQLAVAQPPKQGGSGDSTMGDIMDIAKIAAMFAARGGRIRRAGGGELPPELAGDTDPGDVRLERDAEDAGAPHPPPQLASLAAGPKTPPGGDDGDAPPAAGFAGAAAPGAPEAASEPGFGGTLGHIKTLEGTGPNPRSSAIGVGQLLDGTYMGLLREAHPDIAAQVGSDPASIKAFRRTPQGLALSAELAPMNQNKNRAILEHQGIQVTPTNEHVMWILGAGDGPKVLHADPGTPLRGLISDAAIAANPSIMGGGQTAGGFLGWARKGMNKGGFAGARRGYQDGGDPQLEDAEPNPTPEQMAAEDAVKAGFDPGVVAKQADEAHAAARRSALAPPADPPPPPAPPSGRINDTNDAVGQQASAGFARALAPGAAPATAGYAPADQSAAPSALPPEVEAAAQRQAAANQNLQTLVRGQTQHPQSGGNFLQRAGSWVAQPEHLIPLATGIADMLAAPTKYPLVAATQGLKGGLDAYQQQRAYDLQAAQEGAQQGNLGLDAAVTAAGLPIRAYEAQNVRLGTNAQGLTSVIDFLGNRYTPTGFVDPNDKTGKKVLWRGPKGQLMTQDEVEAQRGTLAGTAGQFFGGNMTNPLKPGALDVGAPGGVSAGPGAAGPVGSLVGAFGGSGAVSPSGSSDAAGDRGRPPNADGSTGPPASSTAVVRRRPAVAAPPAHGANAAAAGPSGPAISADPSLRLSPALRADINNGVFQQAPVAQQVDTSQLDPAWEPKQMTQDIANLQGNGQAAAAAPIQQRLADVTSGKIPPLRKDGTQDFGYQHQQQQIASAADRMKSNAALIDKENQTSLEFEHNRGATMQSWNTLNKIYQDWGMNNWSTHFADTINGMTSVPGLRDLVPEFSARWAAAQGDAAKSAVRQALAQAVQSRLSDGAPASTMSNIKLATPTPDMPPRAKYDLNVQNLALLRQQADWSHVWNAAGLKNHVDDPTALYSRWIKENPIEHYNADAYDDVRPYAGMSWEEMREHPRHPSTQAEFDKEIRTYPVGIPIQGLDGKLYRSPGPRQP